MQSNKAAKDFIYIKSFNRLNVYLLFAKKFNIFVGKTFLLLYKNK